MPSASHYRILVRGRLEPSWSDRLGGLVIENDPTQDPPTTTLTGELADQSALTGVLNALVDLSQTVLSVERVTECDPRSES